MYLALSNGGIAWIPNLTDVDHSLILPVAMATANLAIIQMQVINRTSEPGKLVAILTNTLRALCLVMVPIAAYAPAVNF